MAVTVVLVLAVLLLLSVPIAFAIGLASLAGFFVTDTPLLAMGQRLTTAVAKFSLLSLPFFVFSGELMGQGGISKRLITMVSAFVGHRTGGIATVTIVSAMIFASLSGSGSATTAALGAILIPAMIAKGYSREYAGSVQAVSAELGMIIPPSISMIIYGVTTETSISKVFAGGIVPGVMIGGSLLVLSYCICKRKGYTGQAPASFQEKKDALFGAFWAMLMPLVVLGGIYFGMFTPTEASIVAVVYSFLVGTFVYREITWENFCRSVKNAIVTSGMIMFIIANASLFSWLLTREQVPQRVAEFFGRVAPNHIVFLLLVNALLLVVGMFFDSTTAVSILSGILCPIAISFGIDPVHFGVIMCVNMAIGMVTPPVGVNLFVACRIGNIQMENMVRDLIPYWGVLMLNLGLITFIPQITMFLPNIMRTATGL
ncbi:MAG: TRAP transporter large permease [Planctomycetes bacterium]|nr:TRAP transporter large permease [Planctomycetota bacterium]